MGHPIEFKDTTTNKTSCTTFDIDTLFREFISVPRQNGSNTELANLCLVENGSSSSVSSGPDCPATKPSNELPGVIIDFGTGSDIDKETGTRNSENESIKLFQELLQNGSDEELAKEIQNSIRNGSNQDFAKQFQGLLRDNPDSELVREIKDLLRKNSDKEIARQVQNLIRKHPESELAKEIQELLRNNSDREFTKQIQDLIRNNPDRDLAKEIGKLLRKNFDIEKRIQDLFRNEGDKNAPETPGPAARLGMPRLIEQYRKRQSDEPAQQEKPRYDSRANERQLIRPSDRPPLPDLDDSFALVNSMFTERIQRLEEVPLRRVVGLDEECTSPQSYKELQTEIQRGKSNKELLDVLNKYQEFLTRAGREADAKKVMERSKELEASLSKPWEGLDKAVMDRIDGTVTGKLPDFEKADLETASRIYENIEHLFDKNGEGDNPLLVGYLKWHRFFAEQLKDAKLTEQLTERIEKIKTNQARKYAR